MKTITLQRTTADDHQLIELVDELTEKLQSGETCDLDEYITRFPQYAERLRNWITAMTAMAELGHSLSAVAGVSVVPGSVVRGSPDPAHSASSIDAHSPPIHGEGLGEGAHTLGDFRILRELGRGGMGVVYEAEQLSIGRRVALKVLPFAAMLDRQQLNRFKNEARAAGTLDHPNIVAIHSVGCERGVNYYAMQLIEGQSLAELIAAMKPGRPPSALEPADQRAGPSSAPEPADQRPGPSSALELADQRAGPSSAPASREAAIHSSSTAPDTAKAALPTVHNRGSAAFSTLPAPISTLPAFSSREYFRAVAHLGIQAAEALDHAHQNGILHRDVKPANLLLECSGIGNNSAKLWITDFGLARIEQDAGLTMTGDLLGTLRYMSPEQALAKRVVVDHRSDIYSLGVTLYELLTLQPAFTGDDRQELLRQIAFEEPRKPRQINSRIPADLDTIVLKAIEKEPADRYATAQALAQDFRRFLDDEPIQAKSQTLLATARKWSRRHRSLVWAFVSTLFVSGLVLAASIGWIARDGAMRRTMADSAATRALDEAGELIEEAEWQKALVAIGRAEDALTIAGFGGTSQSRAAELRKDIEMVLRLECIRLNRTHLQNIEIKYETPVDRVEVRDLDLGPENARAFRDFGIDINDLDSDEAAALICTRSIRRELIAALEAWAHWEMEGDIPGWQRLIAIARAADPDPWRNRLRDMLDLAESDRKTALISVAAAAEIDLHPRNALMLANMLGRVSAFREAIALLHRTQQRHPHDYFVNYELAYELLNHADPPAIESASRFSTAAIALRPELSEAHNLHGHILAVMDQSDAAIAHFQQAIQLEPENSLAYFNLGTCHRKNDSIDEAIACLTRAVQLAPDDHVARVCLADVYQMTGALDDAISLCQDTIRLRPDSAGAHAILGTCLCMKGNLDEGIASFRESIRLKPDNANSYTNLSIALSKKGNFAEALDATKKTVLLDPESPDAHRRLGQALERTSRIDEAMNSYREAIRLNPEDALAHNFLGVAYFKKEMMDEAIASWREATRLKPDDLQTLSNLGAVLGIQGRLHEAISVQQDIIRLNPDDPRARNSLAWILATAKDDQLRDGHRAVEIATKACELTDYKDSAIFDTLAAAYAESGDFEAAVKWSKKALELADDEKRDSLEKHLDSFENKKPWRDQ